MTSNSESPVPDEARPVHDGSDLPPLREDIDTLKAKTYDEITAPEQTLPYARELTPEPTDAIGYVDWDDPTKGLVDPDEASSEV